MNRPSQRTAKRDQPDAGDRQLVAVGEVAEERRPVGEVGPRQEAAETQQARTTTNSATRPTHLLPTADCAEPGSDDRHEAQRQGAAEPDTRRVQVAVLIAAAQETRAMRHGPSRNWWPTKHPLSLMQVPCPNRIECDLRRTLRFRSVSRRCRGRPTGWPCAGRCCSSSVLGTESLAWVRADLRRRLALGLGDGLVDHACGPCRSPGCRCRSAAAPARPSRPSGSWP